MPLLSSINLLKVPNLFFYLQKMTHMVFVYGTLKRNEPNHHWLTEPNNGTGTFVGEAKTVKKYPLIIGTRYNIPFLLYEPGVGHFVKGEVYEVDDKMLGNLDVLEEHPNYYMREEHGVQLFINGKPDKELKCWMYFIKNFKKNLLQNTYLEDYRSEGSHGLRYLERSKRDPNIKPSHEILEKYENESTVDDLNDVITKNNEKPR